MYVLDTNVISAVRRPDRAPQVAAWLADKQESDLFLSVITLGEIERGISQQRTRNPQFASDLQIWLDRTLMIFADRVLPFGAAEARIWGRLSQKVGHGGADLMIAATALTREATIVTGNTADFAPTGVRLIDPYV